MDPGTSALDETAYQKLAEDLHTETSAKAILTHLEAFVVGISDPARAGNRAGIFLRAGGLAALVPYLKGTTTSDGTTHDIATSLAVADKATEALLKLSQLDDATRAAIRHGTNIIPPLILALKTAPTVTARSAAASVLHSLADAHPEECPAMAEAYVVELVVMMYHQIASLPPGVWDFPLAKDLTYPGAALVQVLVRSGTRAATDLRRAICSPQPVRAFTALLLVQVRCPCSHPSKKWTVG
jgi:hypothetical protein